jgi:transmembrane sensor
MQPYEIKSFLEKYAIGAHSEEEHQRFIEWTRSASVTELETILEEYKIKMPAGTGEADPRLISSIESAIDQFEIMRGTNRRTGKIISWRKFYKPVAAALILLIAGSILFYSLQPGKPSDLTRAPVPISNNELPPGANKAILTLSNNSTVILDDARNGKLVQQGSSEVTKLANGQLVYKTMDGKTAEVVFNTLTTPRGGQFKLTLPDGSNVWLNAASSITYPTAFTGKERKVEITGEAYFEIAHDAGKPFKVGLNGMEVKVLGTHFNINGYNDEANIKTTLLEGSVSLSKGNLVAMLNPGQQAQLANNGKLNVIDNVDVDQVVAWKNGYFSFSRTDLKSVMRQIARWYDVDIKYEGNIPNRQFGGKIDRNSKASEVLKVLEESKVHFRIEDKNIIVTP